MSRDTASDKLEIFLDGSSRGNPGPAGCGVVIRDADGMVLLEEGYSLGKMTNNAAEYNALIIALGEALILKARSVKVHADSELLVRQMNGQYRVRNEGLKVLHGRASRLTRGFEEFGIVHVPREENREADRLAQQAGRDGVKAAKSRNVQSDRRGHSKGSLF